MSSNRSLARRYAQALFLSSQEKNILDQVEKELKIIVNAVLEHEDLQQLIERQSISPEEKKKVFSTLFKDQISGQTLNFLKLVFDKRREIYLPDMLTEYSILADEARKTIEAEVKTAVELGTEEAEIMREKLKELTGREVRLKIEIDPFLLGGVVIKIGDKVYDGSARQKLNSLRKRLASVHFEEDRGEIAK